MDLFGDCLYISKGFPSVANFNVVTVKKKGANSFEGSPGDHVFIVDLFGRVAYFVEGSSEVEFCNVDNEQEDCIIV